jgi:glutathione S-transferase
MPIIFYAAPRSSASPVSCALRELGVPHERVDVDLAKGEQRKPEYLSLNPNGKVPLLVVDGTPLFEAVAIMQWLGDTYGVEKKLWPAMGDPARLEAVSWSTWAYVSFGSVLVRLFYASSERLPKELHNPAAAAAAQKDLQGLLGLLNDRFEKRQYLLGASYSLADLIVACTINYARTLGVATHAHPALEAWLQRCLSRPALQSPWD